MYKCYTIFLNQNFTRNPIKQKGIQNFDGKPCFLSNSQRPVELDLRNLRLSICLKESGVSNSFYMFLGSTWLCFWVNLGILKKKSILGLIWASFVSKMAVLAQFLQWPGEPLNWIQPNTVVFLASLQVKLGVYFSIWPDFDILASYSLSKLAPGIKIPVFGAIVNVPWGTTELNLVQFSSISSIIRSVLSDYVVYLA